MKTQLHDHAGERRVPTSAVGKVQKAANLYFGFWVTLKSVYCVECMCCQDTGWSLLKGTAALHQQSIFLIKTCMLISFFILSLFKILKLLFKAQILVHLPVVWSQPSSHRPAPYYPLPRNVQHLPFLLMGFLPGLNKADRSWQIVPGSAASCVSQASKNPLCPHMAYCGQLQEIYTECLLENDFFALPVSHIFAYSHAVVCTFPWDDRKYSQTNNKQLLSSSSLMSKAVV